MDDRRLAEAAAEGSREAFDELVRRHQASILNLVRALTGGSADAEDLAPIGTVESRIFRARARLKKELKT